VDPYKGHVPPRKWLLTSSEDISPGDPPRSISTFPKETQPWRVPVQWSRTIRSLVPVRVLRHLPKSPGFFFFSKFHGTWCPCGIPERKSFTDRLHTVQRTWEVYFKLLPVDIRGSWPRTSLGKRIGCIIRVVYPYYDRNLGQWKGGVSILWQKSGTMEERDMDQNYPQHSNERGDTISNGRVTTDGGK
jgi:hypothetical protein